MGKVVEPLLLVNFKTYLESTGKRAVELSKKIRQAGRDTGVAVAVAPQFSDIHQVVTQVEIPVFAQHIDPIGPGAFTGHVLPEAVKAAGASGTLINHSERNVKLADIDRAVELARGIGLTSVVCAGTARIASAAALAEPDMVAIEPPELIGTGRAVSKERPEIIMESVRRIRSVNPNVKVLCGAGISTGEDVYAALKLGTHGILVASGVVRAQKPEEVMLDFCKAVRRFIS